MKKQYIRPCAVSLMFIPETVVAASDDPKKIRHNKNEDEGGDQNLSNGLGFDDWDDIEE